MFGRYRVWIACLSCGAQTTWAASAEAAWVKWDTRHQPPYIILDEVRAMSGKVFICLRCGAKSYNPTDVLYRFCAQCGEFHSDTPPV